jgi:hypothetical protein
VLEPPGADTTVGQTETALESFADVTRLATAPLLGPSSRRR